MDNTTPSPSAKLKADMHYSVAELTLWNKLKNQKLVKQDNPPPTPSHSTWYIRILLGFAGWISACFMFALAGLTLSSFLFNDGNASALFIGIGCCAFAYVNFKAKITRDFTAQLALAFNLCGQFLIGVGIWNLLDNHYSDPKDTLYLLLLLSQLILMFIMPSFSSRVLSSLFSSIALFLYLTEVGAQAVFQPFILLLFILVWSNDLSWKNKKDLWEPIGYGLVIALLYFSSDYFYHDLLGIFSDNPILSLTTIKYLMLLGYIVTASSFILLLNSIRSEYKLALLGTSALKLYAIALLLMLTSYFVQGASVGLALLIIGFLKQRRLILAVGVLSLISFLSWYYYLLDLTLLYKSLVLIGLGLLFGAITLWLHFANQLAELTFSQLRGRYQFNKLNNVILIVMGLILFLVNTNIYQKEQVLENGKLVLLKLAPVDPRSLMQGDYMRLRFSIESNLLDNNKSTEKKTANQGLFIVDLNEHSVGTFNGIFSEQEIKNNQLKMQFRIRDNRIQLATHAFFFEEGTAKQYEAAQYGEFRVAENGELLLNNLRDKDYQVIGYNRPQN
jgi:uncharacterized membrane-anchored protein